MSYRQNQSIKEPITEKNGRKISGGEKMIIIFFKAGISSLFLDF